MLEFDKNHLFLVGLENPETLVFNRKYEFSRMKGAFNYFGYEIEMKIKIGLLFTSASLIVSLICYQYFDSELGKYGSQKIEINNRIPFNVSLALDFYTQNQFVIYDQYQMTLIRDGFISSKLNSKIAEVVKFGYSDSLLYSIVIYENDSIRYYEYFEDDKTNSDIDVREISYNEIDSKNIFWITKYDFETTINTLKENRFKALIFTILFTLLTLIILFIGKKDR